MRGWPTFGRPDLLDPGPWPDGADRGITHTHTQAPTNSTQSPAKSDSLTIDPPPENIVHRPPAHDPNFKAFSQYYNVPALEEQKRNNPNLIFPQDGPQLAFLSTPADIAIYGGAAGGGKTWALLLEALRNISNPHFGAVIFRRTSVQVRNEGGLWDESMRLYPGAGGKPKEHDLTWKFPSGSTVSFAHLEHEKTAHDWQGAQIPLIAFDELTHFTESQFYYLMSRNRSTSGVRPYIRATCNPDVDSWVRDFIDWWIDPDTGYAIPERAGKLRYFIRLGNKLHWGDTPDDLAHFTNPLTGEPIPPKTLTFIPSKLSDNQVLARHDPGYMANLLALPLVERERLLSGNWKIRWQGQQFFDIDNLLLNHQPIADPVHCDKIFAVLDTANKSGSEHDGTAVVWAARNKYHGSPLIILDWEILSIDGALLEHWLPSVFQHGEALAQKCGAREGFAGAWVEDKASGIILLQQAQRRGLSTYPIESKLTALGKDERALSVSGYVSMGKVKLSTTAYHKVMTYKSRTLNHFIQQVESFSLADKDNNKRADDLLDCFTYSVAIGLGNFEGF